MTKQNHEFTGENQAINILGWLNNAPSGNRRRIAEIVELYNKLEQSRLSEAERQVVLARLQKVLDRYTYKYKVLGRETIVMTTRKLSGGHDLFFEPDAVRRIHELRRMKLLNRIRKCGSCQTWIFGRFPSQRFCSVGCRVKANQSDKKWIEHRNAQRRENYHRRKETENQPRGGKI